MPSFHDLQKLDYKPPEGMEKIWLMTGTVAPNEYGNCKGRGSYETSLPGLMQLRTSERQC